MSILYLAIFIILCICLLSLVLLFYAGKKRWPESDVFFKKTAPILLSSENIIRKYLNFLAAYCSIGAACAQSAVLATLLEYTFVSTIIKSMYASAGFNESAMPIAYIFTFIMVFTFFAHAFQVGLFAPAGFPGTEKNTKYVNLNIIRGRVPTDLSDEEYEKLLHNLVLLPYGQAKIAAFWLIVIISCLSAAFIILDPRIIIENKIIIGFFFIALFIHPLLVYAGTEIIISPWVFSLKKILFKRNVRFTEKKILAIKYRAFAFSSVIMVLIYCAMLLPRLPFATSYDLAACLVLVIVYIVALTYFVFGTLLNSFSQIEKAAMALSQGKEKAIFSISQDKEIINATQGFFNAIQTIAQYKKSQEAALQEIREKEEKFRKISENSFDIIVTTDIKGNITYVSPVVEDILGYIPKEVIGKKFDDFINVKEKKRIIKIFFNAVSTGKGYGPGVAKMLDKKGNDVIVEINASLTMKDNVIIGTQAVIRDLRERKKMEAQIRQAQKMEAIGTLAGGIAHDFNNILSPIMGYTDMVRMNLPDGSRAKANLDEVLAASERAKDLVNQILTFSRKTQEEKKPLDIAYIVNEILKFMRSSLPSTIEIKPYIKKDCGTVMADHTQMHQVVMNLCTNAFHAMREDGGILKATLTPIELGPENMPPGLGLNSGPHIKLTISDTGCGIEPEVMDRIFEPYFTTKEVGEGTGMGLAVVHAIVTKHHGAICVESEPGKGAAFDIYFPVMEKMSAKQEAPAKMPILTGDERILLVDDEAPILKMIAQMLKTLGYWVLPQASSEEALKLFMGRSNEFDLVFTDMTMPNMEGDVLAKKILKIRPGIPIILCTGFSEKITPEMAKEMGIAAFITKPVDLKEIAATIREVLDKE